MKIIFTFLIFIGTIGTTMAQEMVEYLPSTQKVNNSNFIIRYDANTISIDTAKNYGSSLFRSENEPEKVSVYMLPNKGIYMMSTYKSHSFFESTRTIMFFRKDGKYMRKIFEESYDSQGLEKLTTHFFHNENTSLVIVGGLYDLPFGFLLFNFSEEKSRIDKISYLKILGKWDEDSNEYLDPFNNVKVSHHGNKFHFAFYEDITTFYEGVYDVINKDDGPIEIDVFYAQ